MTKPPPAVTLFFVCLVFSCVSWPSDGRHDPATTLHAAGAPPNAKVDDVFARFDKP